MSAERHIYCQTIVSDCITLSQCPSYHFCCFPAIIHASQLEPVLSFQTVSFPAWPAVVLRLFPPFSSHLIITCQHTCSSTPVIKYLVYIYLPTNTSPSPDSSQKLHVIVFQPSAPVLLVWKFWSLPVLSACLLQFGLVCLCWQLTSVLNTDRANPTFISPPLPSCSAFWHTTPYQSCGNEWMLLMIKLS